MNTSSSTNPVAALALDELFAEKAGRLVDHPGLGRPGRVADTKELVMLDILPCLKAGDSYGI